MKTAFIARPYEHGAKQTATSRPSTILPMSPTSFEDLATSSGT